MTWNFLIELNLDLLVVLHHAVFHWQNYLRKNYWLEQIHQ